MGRHKPKPKPHQAPGWSLRGMSYAVNPPSEICAWERFLAKEKIEERDVGTSTKVWKFVHQNWDKCYIPTKVLKMYDMDMEL